jgi:hypothetical protein
MNRHDTRKRVWLLILAAISALILMWGGFAGNLLIVDAPRPADVILVLAGGPNRRPERALQLLLQGYGRNVVIDVPADAKVYGFAETDLAQRYIEDLPQAAVISVCPIVGLSTRDESKDAEVCLARLGAKSVLLVTSDYHTRRALDVFRHAIPQYDYSVAAARDDKQFGARWWTRRQWAKTFVDECLRLIWWECIDKWR